jgi:putative nucleotidyltransferase with HDIG domain
VEITLTRIVPASEKKIFQPLDLEDLIVRTPFLPPAFELIPKLLLLLDDPDVNCEALAEIIHIDAGLTADVLHASNSASHGGSRRTESVSDAIIRVGLRDLYQMVMKIVTAPALTSPDVFRFQRIDLWRHSLATAIASQVLARHLTDEDPEIVFTAGLLHDIGKVVFAHAAGKAYSDLLEGCVESSRIVHRAELESFQLNHMEIGASLLRSWRFPEQIVSAIAGHHAPLLVPQEHAVFTALLYAGNILAYRIGQGNGYPPYSVRPDPGALGLLNLRPEDLKGYEDEILELVQREQERLW